MFAIEVLRNGTLLSRAGMTEASSVLVSMHSFADGDTPGSIHVIGLSYLSEDRTAHVLWVDETPLVSGDRISMVLVESISPSQPILIQPHDSAAYAEQIEQFAEQENADVAPMQEASRRWPNTSYRCSVNERSLASATYRPDEVRMLCTVTWDRRNPDCMNAYVRSLDRTSNATKWVRADLSLGDEFAVVLAA
jgi:hypothetical protein